MDEFPVPSSSSTTTSAVAQQQPQPTSPCAQLVHILMCYCQGGENPEFIRKAIESLVKKLKERREQLDALISAITSGGKQQTCCVTIHRSLDGRLQVAGRKGVPNVVYARIWRWPTVSKTELVKLPICTTPAEHPDLICINPYHYDRIVSSGLIGLETPSPFRMESLPSTSSTHFNDTTAKLECHQPPEFDPKTVQEHSQYEGNYSMGQYPSNQPNFVLSHHACGNNIVNSANNSAIENNFSIQQNEWDGNQQNATMFNPAQLHQDQTNPKSYHLPPLHSHPTHWCSINYFELDTQIGETFKAPWTMLDVHIDGGMDPTGAEAGRFCLGALSNVHRSEASERARLHIGKGIRLSMDAEGNAVFLECLSQKGIFVQSYFLDHQHNLQPGTAVHKFCTGTHRKVFDLQWAYAEMCAQKQNAHLAAMVQAYAVAGIPQSAAGGSSQKSPTGMDDLRRACCTISLSFVKGWGAGYARTSIKETPCWIEIQLHRPLQLLNELLLMN